MGHWDERVARIEEKLRDFRCGGTPGKPGRYEIRNWLPGVHKSGPCPGCEDCKPTNAVPAITDTLLSKDN